MSYSLTLSHLQVHLSGKGLLLMKMHVYLNPFPHTEAFRHLDGRQILKTLWKMEKLLTYQRVILIANLTSYCGNSVKHQ